MLWPLVTNFVIGQYILEINEINKVNVSLFWQKANQVDLDTKVSLVTFEAAISDLDMANDGIKKNLIQMVSVVAS